MLQSGIDQLLQCPCCLSQSFQEVLSLDNKRKKNSYSEYSKKYYQKFLDQFPFDKVVLVKCNKCLHLFYQYQPSETFLNEMYSIHKKNKIKNLNFIDEKKVKKARKLLSKILNLSKCKTLLDFGSGSGYLKDISAEFNLDYYGYEPSKERNLILSENNIFSNFDDLSRKNIKFDIIIINQVLEHIKNPLFVMRDIKNLCHSNTIIYVSVPNFNRSKEGSKFFDSWPYDPKFNHHKLAPFQHLHCFNTYSLFKLMNNSGFKMKLDFKTILDQNIFILRILLGLVIKKISTTDIIFELK